MHQLSIHYSEISDFVNDCRILYKISSSTVRKLICYYMKNNFEAEILQKCISEVESITNLYQQMAQTDVEIHSYIYSDYQYNTLSYNYEVWMKKICHQYDSLLHVIRSIISTLLKLYTKETLLAALKLIESFNRLVSLNISDEADVRFINTLSSVFENKKKFTINRILKIIARDRTEICARDLVEALIRKFSEIDKVNSPLSSNTDVDENLANDDDAAQLESDCTSILVYKTLTQYTSPAEIGSHSVERTSAKIQNQIMEPAMAYLVLAEQKNLNILFSGLANQSTDLLGETEVKSSKKNGCLKIRSKVKQKFFETYDQILWQNVGIIGEHILLWWSDNGFGRKNHLMAQKFCSWLKQYHAKGNIHMIILPTIQSLIDCQCCYITSTSWDELFSQALISASYQHSRHELHDIGLGTKTGHLFSDLLYDTVFLCNSCEGSNWTIQDIENLPIVEQIPLLHRLDHSIHTARLWAIGRAKYLTNCWNMEQFFKVTHVDINASLYALNQLKLAQNIKLPNQAENCHFSVCFKMRAKLMSEVRVNIDKLQEVPAQSLSILASVCKITSLAYLKICFPSSVYWQQPGSNQQNTASEYVEKYLNEILKPVLLSSQNLPLPVQKSVSKLVLEILCEAWLDHIYKYRIKFSECGAVQLLLDFAGIPIWMKEKVMIGDDISRFLQTDEILRRCEGVGRLLLRQPGDSIIMTTENQRTSTQEIEVKDIDNDKDALMPPEMYVPNQEKWLKLRLNKQKSSSMICCKQFNVYKC